MRSLTAARILVLDADHERRAELCRALQALGMPDVSGIANVAEAASSRIPPPELFVVHGATLAANDDGGAISPNPFTASGAPAILLLPDASSFARKAAAKAGYPVVLGTPVSARLLYRRIAHVLQVTRRAKRRMKSQTPAATRTMAVAPELPVLADLPAV
jgi:hypothetical protein